jgi:hypothetical protein
MEPTMREERENITITNEALAAISVSALLHPTQHFNHPRDVLAAEHIGKDEKRAILASWASGQFAIESMPILRHYPGTERAVSYDEILGALKALDEDPQSPDDPAAALRKPSRSRPQESLAGITKKLNIRKLWKGEYAPRIADA